MCFFILSNTIFFFNLYFSTYHIRRDNSDKTVFIIESFVSYNIGISVHKVYTIRQFCTTCSLQKVRWFILLTVFWKEAWYMWELHFNKLLKPFMFFSFIPIIRFKGHYYACDSTLFSTVVADNSYLLFPIFTFTQRKNITDNLTGIVLKKIMPSHFVMNAFPILFIS